MFEILVISIGLGIAFTLGYYMGAHDQKTEDSKKINKLRNYIKKSMQ